MSLVTIATNFARLDGDAVRDLQAAARFNKRASVETLGRHFVAVRADMQFAHIQRVTFNVEGPAMPLSLQALVDELARICRQEVAAAKVGA